MSLPRLAVLFDYPQEGWPSMDLVAEMLCRQLDADHSAAVRTTRICPEFRDRATVWPMIGKRKGARDLDRFLNRFWYYPRYLRREAAAFDFFHVADHSYSHLVHELPTHRTGVFCHDLDAFRCLLEPSLEPRPRWYRRMTKRILDGLQKAEIVFYSTQPIRKKIEEHSLIDPLRLIHAPYGIAPEFTDEFNGEESEVPPLAGLDKRPYLLHVGSCIPRKRIDILLDVFARVRARHPDLLLVQVCGTWTDLQREQIERLQIAEAIIQVRGLERKTLAALYRQARVVLQPSEAEGFGLPVAEALACGAIVAATDIPVLREVGGEAAVYCPLGDLEAWTATIDKLLNDPDAAPAPLSRLAHAQKFSWSAHARIIVNAYQRLLQEK